MHARRTPRRSLSSRPPRLRTPPRRAAAGRTDFEGFSSDETVRVVMSGNQEPRGVDLTEEAYAQGPEVGGGSPGGWPGGRAGGRAG